MPISVFAVLPSQEPLRKSATAELQKRSPDFGLEHVKTPPLFTIDPTVPAVAIGDGDPATSSLESLHPDNSQMFVVSGTVAVDDPGKVPVQSGGVQFFSDPPIDTFQTCIGTGAVGGVAQVAAKLNLATLAKRGLDGTNVAIAIMDTGINLNHLNAKRGKPTRNDPANSWTPPGFAVPLPFNHPVAHGTMCAFDALLAAPNATLLDYPILAIKAAGGAVSGSTLKQAFLAYASLIANWAIAFAPGGVQKYAGLVVNNSWGIYHPSWDFPVGHPGRFIDNPKHPFNLQVAMLAASGADILFAAGNCGAQCPDMRCKNLVTGVIMGTNASADVLTVAGCDINDLRVGYSSQGPSIAGMPQEKPDLTAYTHFLGSEYGGAGTPDTGTSAACPVASGCVAALRTKLAPSVEPPAQLFARLRSGARQPAGMPIAAWNRDYGWGIIDPNKSGMGAGV